MKEPKLSPIQLGLLILLFLFGNIAIINPMIVVGRDSWILSILALCMGLILCTIILSISNYHPDETLVGICQYCFGKVIGNILVCIYLLIFLYDAAINLRVLGDYFATVSYSKTPIVVFLILLTLTITYAVSEGLEILGKVSEIFAPILLVLFAAVSTSMFTFHDFNNFKPILEYGLWDFIKKGFPFMEWPYGDLLVFLMIYPYLNKQNKKRKVTYWGVVGAGVLIILFAIRNIAILGPALSSKLTYPANAIAKLIPGVSIEPLIDINLLIGSGIKIGVLLYAASHGAAEMMGIHNYKPLVPAFSSFILIFSIWIFDSAIEQIAWFAGIEHQYYVLPFYVIVPLLMLVITVVKKKKPPIPNRKE
jgi:spore germination protein KB